MRRGRGVFRLCGALALVAGACGGGKDPVATVEKGSVRGTVMDETGGAVANAGVTLSGNGQSARTATSGADGVYAFAGLAAGTYALTVSAPAGYAVGATATSSVAVTGGTQASVSAFILNRVIPPNTTGSVRGSVADSSSTPVANVVVTLTGNGQPARTATTAANGIYTFTNVAAGTYALTIAPPPGFTMDAGVSSSIEVTTGVQANATLFVLNRLTGQAASDSMFVAALRTRLQELTQAESFSGAVLVLRNGQTLFERAWNNADRELGVANTTATQFRVGSMNKMLTGVATLQLVQAGKLRLDQPIGTYLPDYPNADLASRVTVHHLLTHIGGTGDIFGPDFQANRFTLREPSDYIALYGTRAVKFTPGTQFDYSNYGFMLLGAVIERVSGMSYDAYVAANIHAASGMTATGALPENVVVPGRATGYTRLLVPGQLVSNAQTLPYRGTPAGGGYSTVRDMARFAMAIEERRLLDPAHTTLLLDGKITLGPGEQYAYGFVDRVVLGRRFVGHSGGAAGMNGELLFEPNGGYVISVLSNFDPQAAGQVASYILSLIVAPPQGQP